MRPEPRTVDSPEFTDRIKLRLVPRDEIDAEVLRSLIAVIEQAQKHDRRKSFRMMGRKPEKAEHAEQQQAVSRAFTRIEQIAASSRQQAERLANNVKASGPLANADELADAVADLNAAVAFVNSLRGRIDARPLV